MNQTNDEVLVDVKTLEALLPGKRILSTEDLEQFHSFLFRLWEHTAGFPAEFRQAAFLVKELFDDYILGQPGPHRPTKAEAVERLSKLLPRVLNM